MNGILWLASYPKSGNTWLRLFLTNLLRNDDEPADINEPEATPIASARGIIDDEAGIETSDMTMAEIEQLRPLVYEQLVAQAEEPLLMKVHDAWTLLPDGTPLLSAQATRGAIYIIRNPLDVVISAANFNGTDIDTAITCLADMEAKLARGKKKLPDQLQQRLLSWSGHVLSWVDSSQVPVHILRYEDMSQDPLSAFTGAARFAGLDFDQERIPKAIRFSSFEELHRQELAKGFKEKSAKQEFFFRKGKAGGWRNVLRRDQIDRIIADHGSVMERFGYL